MSQILSKHEQLNKLIVSETPTQHTHTHTCTRTNILIDSQVPICQSLTNPYADP